MQHTSDVAPGARSHWRRKRLFKLDLKQGKRDGEERESRDSAAVPSLVIRIGARPQSETRQYNKKNKRIKRKLEPLSGHNENVSNSRCERLSARSIGSEDSLQLQRWGPAPSFAALHPEMWPNVAICCLARWNAMQKSCDIITVSLCIFACLCLLYRFWTCISVQSASPGEQSRTPRRGRPTSQTRKNWTSHFLQKEL